MLTSLKRLLQKRTIRWETFDSTVTDSGNSPTSTIRQGQVVARQTADGNIYLYDPDANDGTQEALGILSRDVPISGDTRAPIIWRGEVDESAVLGLDPRAKQQLATRIAFDDSPRQQANPLMAPSDVTRVSSDYTVVAADSGTLFLATGAVNFTLPTKANGLAFLFAQCTNNDMVITSAGSDIVAVNTFAASTLTFNTSNQKIGSQVLVRCVYSGTNTLRWLATNLGGTTMTPA